MTTHLTVGDAATQIEKDFGLKPCPPRAITDLIYERRVDVSQCPMQGGRRLIPRDMLSDIATLLKRSTRLQSFETRTLQSVLAQSTPLAEAIDAVDASRFSTPPTICRRARDAGASPSHSEETVS